LSILLVLIGGLLRVSQNSGRLQTGIRAAGDASFSSGVIVETGQWYHTCGVFAADNDRTLYLNGDFIDSETTSTIPDTFTGTMLGYAVDAYHMSGKLDEVKVYDRALSPGEICDLCSAHAVETGVTCDPAC